MKRMFKMCFAICLLMAVMLFSAYGMTAFAYTDEGTEQVAATTDVETKKMDSSTVITEQDDKPFSVPGNGEIVDDVTDDTSKQFVTIQTKNGGTFFLVLDRSSNTENVYMLTMVDEADLAEFVEEESQKEVSSLVIPEKEETTPVEKKVNESSEKDSGTGRSPVFFIVLLIVGVSGGGYYFKVVKPKKEDDDAEEENLEFDDSVTCINADMADDNGEDEEEE